MTGLDYEKLGKSIGIDNLEEEINKIEQMKKEKQDKINKKYPITKDDILMFSNIFYDKKLEKITNSYTYTDYMLLPGTLLIPFGYRNEIINDVVKEKIKLFFKFFQRKMILIHLKEYKIHKKSDKNNFIKHLLDKYKIKKGDPQNRNYIHYMGYGESLNENLTLWEKIKRTFSKNKPFTVELKRNGANYFITDLLDDRIEDFMENLDYGIDFNMMIVDKDMVVNGIFGLMEDFETKIEKPKQIEILYNDIKEQIGNKINYPGNILLSYPLNDYIDSKNLYHNILYDLHDMEYLTLKEIYVFENSLNFVIEKINRFTPELINNLFPIYERISFENGKLKLDSKILLEGKKKGDKIYELIDIIVEGIKKYERLEFTYGELKEIFLNDIKRFPYFYKTISQKNEYENTLKQLKKEKDEEILKTLNKHKEYLINKVFCLSFFNSSLNKEKIDFILNEKTTGLLINRN